MSTGAHSVDYALIASALTRSLSLQHPPIAISFSEERPSGIDAFRYLVPAGCRFWEEAATKAFATEAPHHGLCAIGVYTHNLQESAAQQADLTDTLSAFKQLRYVRDEDLPLIPVLHFRPRYVIYSPLAETPLNPDVVLLFVTANQTLILCEATQQVENQNPPAMGRPACATVPQVVNTGRAALSMGCCGARAYINILTENVAVFAIPGQKLMAYMQTIETLANANTVLSKFHSVRRRDIEAGKTPAVADSLAALAATP